MLCFVPPSQRLGPHRYSTHWLHDRVASNSRMLCDSPSDRWMSLQLRDGPTARSIPETEEPSSEIPASDHCWPCACRSLSYTPDLGSSLTTTCRWNSAASELSGCNDESSAPPPARLRPAVCRYEGKHFLHEPARTVRGFLRKARRQGICRFRF